MLTRSRTRSVQHHDPYWTEKLRLTHQLNQSLRTRYSRRIRGLPPPAPPVPKLKTSRKTSSVKWKDKVEPKISVKPKPEKKSKRSVKSEKKSKRSKTSKQSIKSTSKSKQPVKAVTKSRKSTKLSTKPKKTNKKKKKKSRKMKTIHVDVFETGKRRLSPVFKASYVALGTIVRGENDRWWQSAERGDGRRYWKAMDYGENIIVAYVRDVEDRMGYVEEVDFGKRV